MPTFVPAARMQIHTPDSSRYWLADTYNERHGADLEPQNIDKEFLRLWFRGRCDPYADKVRGDWVWGKLHGRSEALLVYMVGADYAGAKLLERWLELELYQKECLHGKSAARIATISELWELRSAVDLEGATLISLLIVTWRSCIRVS